MPTPLAWSSGHSYSAYFNPSCSEALLLEYSIPAMSRYHPEVLKLPLLLATPPEA